MKVSSVIILHNIHTAALKKADRYIVFLENINENQVPPGSKT